MNGLDCSERGSPPNRDYNMAELCMNKKISLLLVGLVALDIIDGDFKDLSALDAIKGILYITCFTLMIWNYLKDKGD